MESSVKMKSGVAQHYERLFERYPNLECMRKPIMAAFDIMRQSYQQGKKVMTCGNGGSAADAEHIVGELMKGFYLPRKIKNPPLEGLQGALPAIALTQHTALATAIINDTDASLIFAQQVYGYGQDGDVLVCISTSGNAEN
ncbi:MAG: SIS domain-containing protein, partial [Defluviitaleaceae bacterium]|nr:SIS domain-containing protein [Defluviitaleaceae bacterium]